MISYTRQLDPNHLLTLGFYGAVGGSPCNDPSAVNGLTYDPTIAAEFAPAVDFVSLHYFLSERCFEGDLQALQTKIGNKPLLLEEFGLHTLVEPDPSCQTNPSNPLCDDPHTETEQAAYYNALLFLGEAYNLAGYLFWTLNDFSYILSNTQKSHHCQGVLHNSLVKICQQANPTNYNRKLAAGVAQHHYQEQVAYVDLFNGWVDLKVDAPPAGWRDNWQEGGALLRSYDPTNLLWSQNLGNVAFTKFVSQSTSITGVALSPVLSNVNINLYPFLTGRVSNYSIRDSINGSNTILRIGVKESDQVTRLLTMTPNSHLPHCFRLDLRRPPTDWQGVHHFQIRLELVPEAGKNGYSAAYEFDWLAVESGVPENCIYLPIIHK